jgi:hypothetical protein
VLALTSIAIGPAAFPGAPQITFTGLANGSRGQLCHVGGVQFSYSFGPGHVVVEVGPGNTNNVIRRRHRIHGNTTAILTLSFPRCRTSSASDSPASRARANALTISLFNGATNVGESLYNGVPDPISRGLCREFKARSRSIECS